MASKESSVCRSPSHCCLPQEMKTKMKGKTLHFKKKKDMPLHKSEEVNVFCVCGKYRPRGSWNCWGSKHSICLRFLSAAIQKIMFSLSFSPCLVLWLFHNNGHFKLNRAFPFALDKEGKHFFVLFAAAPSSATILYITLSDNNTYRANFTVHELVYLLCISPLISFKIIK